MNAPMLVPLLGLIAGIIAGLCGAGVWWSAGIALLASAVWYVVNRLSGNPLRGFRLNGYHYIWIFLAFVSAGILSLDINRPYMAADCNDVYAADGRIWSVTQSTSGDRALVDIRRLIHSDGHVENVANMRIRLCSDAIVASVDDDIIFPLNLKRIVDSPGSFDTGFATAMRGRGILYTSKCTGADIQVYGHTATLAGTADGIRDRMEAAIEKTPLDRDTRDFLITVLLGDRSYLDRGTRDLFADAGISHLLALSGMHVAIISGIIVWLLFPLNFFGYYRQRLVVAVVLLLGYAFLTGWQPSTVRATLMMASVVAGMCLERRHGAWNSLILATFVILLFSPLSLADVGLQLSFLCVASLIFLVNPLNPFDHHEHPALYRLCGMILTAVAATFGTWCVSAYYFGTVPVMFLPANLLALPLLPAYITMAIIYFALHACGMNAGILVSLLDYGHDALVGMTSWLTAGGATAVSFSPSVAAVALWLLFAASLAVCLNSTRSRWKNVTCCALGAAFTAAVCLGPDAEAADGFIIKSGLSPVTVTTRISGKQHTVTFRPRTTCSCVVAGKNITVVDETPDSALISSLPECDFMVLASGYKGDLADIARHKPRGQFVIHTSVRRARERALLHMADSLGLECHSIRIDGPLKVLAQ